MVENEFIWKRFLFKIGKVEGCYKVCRYKGVGRVLEDISEDKRYNTKDCALKA